MSVLGVHIRVRIHVCVCVCLSQEHVVRIILEFVPQSKHVNVYIGVSQVDAMNTLIFISSPFPFLTHNIHHSVMVTHLLDSTADTLNKRLDECNENLHHLGDELERR